MITRLLRATFGRMPWRGVVEVIGFGLLSVAAWEVYHVAGLAAGGLSLLYLGTFGGRR